MTLIHWQLSQNLFICTLCPLIINLKLTPNLDRSEMIPRNTCYSFNSSTWPWIWQQKWSYCYQKTIFCVINFLFKWVTRILVVPFGTVDWVPPGGVFCTVGFGAALATGRVTVLSFWATLSQSWILFHKIISFMNLRN